MKGQFLDPCFPFEPWHDKTNNLSDCAPSEDSDQPGHPPSLIRVFAVHMMKAWTLSYQLRAQRRLWSDWADAQADLNLRWAHSHFVGFVMSWLICFCFLTRKLFSHIWTFILAYRSVLIFQFRDILTSKVALFCSYIYCQFIVWKIENMVKNHKC